MQAPHRSAHMVIWILIAVILSLSLLLGLSLRQDKPFDPDTSILESLR